MNTDTQENNILEQEINQAAVSGGNIDSIASSINSDEENKRIHTIPEFQLNDEIYNMDVVLDQIPADLVEDIHEEEENDDKSDQAVEVPNGVLSPSPSPIRATKGGESGSNTLGNHSPTLSNRSYSRRNSFSRNIAKPKRRKDSDRFMEKMNLQAGDRSPTFFSKNVFNQNTRLPRLEKQQSHLYFHEIYQKQRTMLNSASMPAIKKIPGMLNKTRETQYISRFEKKKEEVNYNIFENKYRNVNPLGNQLKLTSDLYSHIKWKKHKGKDFVIKNVDCYKNGIVDDLEKEYIKTSIKIMPNLDPIDADQKDLEGLVAHDKYYKHYKKLDRVLQQNELTGTKPSIYTKLLKSTSAKRLLPLKLGVLTSSHNHSSLNLK